MTLQSLIRIGLVASFICLTIGLSGLALSVERALTAEQWTEWQTTGIAPRENFSGAADPSSRDWTYAQYLDAKSETNRAKASCGLTSLSSECALNGYAAPINWLGLAFLTVGVGAFVRLRMTDPSSGVYA